MKRRLGMGLVGPGFIATHHIDAVRRLGYVDVVALASDNVASARVKADDLSIPKVYGDFNELLADPDIHVVHNTTPSFMHHPINLAAIRAGKHIISDKPLALTPEQCLELRDAAAEAGVVNAVTFNYRGNPLVQQARAMVAADEIGPVHYVHGQYIQDWMTDPHVYQWRMDPKLGGNSSALADIGSHWCDLAQHILGSPIVSVLADLSTGVPTRYRAAAAAEAFAKTDANTEKEAVPMTLEDTASVLLRFANGARGCMKVGQIMPGHKNDLQIELNGHKASLGWKQEEQNALWIGRVKQPNESMAKDPGLMVPDAAQFAHLPGGHQEGWPDAFRNVVAEIYKWVLAGGAPAAKPPMVSDFANGYAVSCVIAAMLRSHAAGGVWCSVEMQPAKV